MNTASRRIAVCLGLGAGLLCFSIWQATPLSLRNFIFFLTLTFISISDLTEYKVPNISIVICITDWASGLVFSLSPIADLKDGLIAGLVFGLGTYFLSVMLRVLLRKKVLGGGDIKLFFVTGLFLGIDKMLYMLVIACALGLVTSMIFRRKRIIPFAPSIAMGTIIMIMISAY